MANEQLIRKVVPFIEDYRQNGIMGNIDAFDHTRRWIEQFEAQDSTKNNLLIGTSNMLNHFYLSREKSKHNLAGFYSAILDQIPGRDFRNAKFIRTQENGKSQTDLLALSNEVFHDILNLNISVNDCHGDGKTFIYIDDCIYSGNKFRYDIAHWMQNNPSLVNFKLITYHQIHHSQGFPYARNEIIKTISHQGGALYSWKTITVNNDKSGTTPLEIFWPKSTTNQFVESFVNKTLEQARNKGWNIGGIAFRTNQKSEIFFSTEHASTQETLEKLFLIEGSKLYLNAKSPAESMRPMGFEKLTTLGFGSPVVTYRNIANNCPLVLWYGDPENYGMDHPLGQWYPLFKRKI